MEMDESDAYLIIPLEFQELFFAFNGPSYRERVRGNTVIARLSRGLLHYYGCLPLLELAKMINKLLPQPVELARIGEVLREIGFYNWDIVFERGFFCDGRLTDLDYTLSELRAREALEYRPSPIKRPGRQGIQPFSTGTAGRCGSSAAFCGRTVWMSLYPISSISCSVWYKWNCRHQRSSMPF